MARIRVGLNQAEVARRMGITKQSVQHWEKEDAMPRQSRILELAQILQVDAQWLLTGESQEEWEDEELGKLLTLAQRQLLEQHEKLTPENKMLLAELAETLRRNQEEIEKGQRRTGTADAYASAPPARPQRPRLVDDTE